MDLRDPFSVKRPLFRFSHEIVDIVAYNDQGFHRIKQFSQGIAHLGRLRRREHSYLRAGLCFQRPSRTRLRVLPKEDQRGKHHDDEQFLYLHFSLPSVFKTLYFKDIKHLIFVNEHIFQ
jgi:hypothetical protein